MSKHWNPDGTPWVTRAEFKALSLKQRRALYAERAAVKRRNQAVHFNVATLRQQLGWQSVMTVLLGAAFLGVVGGAALNWRNPVRAPAAEPAPPRVEQKIETITLPVIRDQSDIEWERRAQDGGSATGSPPSGGARNDGVRVAFGSCKWGGGKNCVVDGDTFYIGGQKVRIANIDAPETHDYRCASELALGDQATAQLQALLNSGAVTMTSIDRDRDVYGRLLRNVSVNGADVGEALIASGVARAYAGGRRPWC